MTGKEDPKQVGSALKHGGVGYGRGKAQLAKGPGWDCSTVWLAGWDHSLGFSVHRRVHWDFCCDVMLHVYKKNNDQPI